MEDITLESERKNAQLLERIYRVYRETIYPKGKLFLFIDEIQSVENWERWVETYRESGEIKCICSGSSSKIASYKGGHLLTGRHIDQLLLPLSFKDYLLSKNVSLDLKSVIKNKNSIKALLNQYLHNGGFPEVLLNFNIDKGGSKLLEQYFYDIIYRDIVDRWEIRDIDLVKKCAFYALKNVANRISYRKMQRIIESSYGSVSINTITEYFSHLREAFLIFECLYYSNSEKQKSIRPKKMYAMDPVLKRTVTQSLTKDYGREIENYWYLELLRLGFRVFYWMDEKTEVDFICQKGADNYAINCAYSNLEDPDLKERELKGLAAFPEDVKKRILITEDIEDVVIFQNKTITLIPFWKFLIFGV
ncbi:MAG TPA: ATP-binding protein [Thermotogota bacterium]|nr:ATP-binding protein [Thermotogota bacterium]